MRAWFTDRNVKRALTLGLFVGSLYTFRHLALLLVFFVVFQRSLGTAATFLRDRTGLSFRAALLLVLLLALGVLGGGLGIGISRLVHHLPELRSSAETVVRTIEGSDLYHRYGHGLSERVVEQVRHNAQHMVGVAATAGREALYLLLGLLFAVLFLLEREELVQWRDELGPDSIPRIMMRYLGHVADAIAITLKLQVIVAVVNALVTLPVLIALQLPGIPALAAMLLITGLIPVVGGPIAGSVLMTLAYVTKGPGGLAAFVVSTFLLHKVESYYLAPRLTARHVKLPGFVLITSLVLFEHAFGIVGLFLSFPTLYVTARIREGWRDPELEAREEREQEDAISRVLPALRGRKIRKDVVAALAEKVSGEEPPAP